MTNSLYKNTISIDEKTGLPADYLSLIAGYRPLVENAARRLRIPEDDIDDAVQEVETKFYLKGGLDFYDPERKTKFASMYRSWCSMFMLQERDKTVKYVGRNQVKSPDLMVEYVDDTSEEGDFSLTSDANQFLSSWLQRAKTGLEEIGREDLVPLLLRCAKAAEDNVAVSRKDVVEITGVPIDKATARLKELRKCLTEIGFGMESLTTSV